MLVLVGSHLIARQVSGVLAKMSKYISRENYNIFDINSISDFLKIATSINSCGDHHGHRQVHHGCFAHLCTSFWTDIAFLPSQSAKVSTQVLWKN